MKKDNSKVAKLLTYYMELSKQGREAPTSVDWKPDSSHLKRVVALHNKVGGISYDLSGRDTGSVAETKEPSFAVSIFPTRGVRIPGKLITVQDIEAYIKKNADLLSQGSVMLGTWYDKGKNKTYLDCAVKILNHDLPIVEGMAKGLGIVHRQLAIFNLQSMDEFSLPKNLQSNRAMAIDRSRLAQVVLPITGVDTWARRPERYDIAGLDTPAKRKRRKRRSRKFKPLTQGLAGMR